jgi:MFS family permease
MRLPFFYGWVIVAVAFVTMGIGFNVRTAFSLLFPPILDEFGWERGVTAGAFSFGFLVSAGLSPLLGRLMDHRGPRLVIEIGCGLHGRRDVSGYPGISMSPSACWLAAAVRACLIPVNRCSCRTGSCAGGAWQLV